MRSGPARKSISKVYQRWGPRLNLKPWLRHFAHTSPNFYRGKVKKLASIFDPIAFNALYFRNWGTDLKIKSKLKAQMIVHVPSKFDVFPSTLLWEPSVGIYPRKNIRAAKSSITRARFAWLCWNLMRIEKNWLDVKTHFRWNPRWRTALTFQSLNRCNSAARCSISLRFA